MHPVALFLPPQTLLDPCFLKKLRANTKKPLNKNLINPRVFTSQGRQTLNRFTTKLLTKMTASAFTTTHKLTATFRKRIANRYEYRELTWKVERHNESGSYLVGFSGGNQSIGRTLDELKKDLPSHLSGVGCLDHFTITAVK